MPWWPLLSAPASFLLQSWPSILLCMQTMLERACMIACCMLVLLALPRHCLSALLGARTRSHVEATSVLLTRPRPASAGHQQVSCWSACLAYTVSL